MSIWREVLRIYTSVSTTSWITQQFLSDSTTVLWLRTSKPYYRHRDTSYIVFLPSPAVCKLCYVLCSNIMTDFFRYYIHSHDGMSLTLYHEHDVDNQGWEGGRGVELQAMQCLPVFDNIFLGFFSSLNFVNLDTFQHEVFKCKLDILNLI